MLTFAETTVLGCKSQTIDSCRSYLYTNTSISNTEESPYGYWLSTASSFRPYYGWHMHYDGSTNSIGVGNSTNNGVRPVITITKTL